jgi:nitrogen regulatory protein PII
MSDRKTIELVTVIAESVLEKSLSKDIERLGARGYTIQDVRGKGARGYRAGEWNESSNIQIEILCDEAVAREIENHLNNTYFDNYGMIIYTSKVSVLRSDKFSKI